MRPLHRLRVHGGIGFTWGQEVHLSFKRAVGDEPFFGPVHRLRVLAADAVGLSGRPEVTV